MFVKASAVVFATLIAVSTLFQLALAAGAPWGHLAMGGRYPGRFPPGPRVAAVVQGALLTAMGVCVLARAGWLSQTWSGLRAAAWVVVGISALSMIMNWATPSKPERALWAPVGTLLFLSSLVVALSP
ncbi:MAG TPA: hypothetical protein VE549_07165 [Myxococcaceae bacterium]|nr:hypothetical protein [Myxococcaceae bacterium]